MNYTFTTDDKDEAAMLAYASEAWAALSDVRNTLRLTMKHEPKNPHNRVESLYTDICETLARIER